MIMQLFNIPEVGGLSK